MPYGAQIRPESLEHLAHQIGEQLSASRFAECRPD
jgi:hypothetical protein